MKKLTGFLLLALLVTSGCHRRSGQDDQLSGQPLSWEALDSINANLPPGIVLWIGALFLAGFGLKAAAMPFHAWLPAAMVAPTPVSALLHAVAVVKAGVFTIIKIVLL